LPDLKEMSDRPNGSFCRHLNPSRRMRLSRILVLVFFLPISQPSARAASATILGWNNLGMHCMDSDYSVFSVLPPYNTIEAQLIVAGKLVTNGGGYSITYQAVADPDGSFNSTAVGKGNFFTYAPALYGTALAPETGLLGWMMPGVSNTPQPMLFEATNVPAAGVATKVNWFRAEGIPISPYDDAHNKNAYPMMRMIAWNSAKQPVATNDVVLPVSDEMDCRACHASGTQAAAQPAAGWVWNGLPERDYRLNILRLHDERQFALHSALYSDALAARGFNSAGLYRGVIADGKPVLCASCHASEALGAPSYKTIPPLTASVHSFHAHVMDPVLNTTLDNAANRAACYRCHPGSTTRCLRGAMGGAIAADGSMEMQCQSCHGNMSQVGSSSRVGWFMEPTCQSCHTGTATSNNGQIRYTSALVDTNGTPRQAVDSTFATSPNTPAAGLSMYRFSVGHGGLQCSACHGSTHAEFPSIHRNDNVRNIELQGHAGVMVECAACHTNSPNTITGGPHGMHPVGAAWVSSHHNVLENGQATRAQCQVCHGTDYRGTVLSRMQADRTLSAFGTKVLARGSIVGCYTCHSGPGTDSVNSSTQPTTVSVSTNTTNDRAVSMVLPATGTGITLRILAQPANGSVGLTNTVATYFPNPGFVGTDTFTFAAYDGSKNSLPATGSVVVDQGPYSIGASAVVPATYPAGWPVAMVVIPSVTNHAAAPSFLWTFGDGTSASTNQYAAHSYAQPGTYSWSVTVTVAGASTQRQGTIVIGTPISLVAKREGGQFHLRWPDSVADSVLEASPSLGPSAHWTAVTAAPSLVSGSLTLNLPASTASNQFLRVRRTW
jgi:PKD repeat protein/ferredoxin